TFAYFIHHISTTVQVGKLVIELVGDSERVLGKFAELGESASSFKKDWKPNGIKQAVKPDKAGFIAYIHFEEILEYADKKRLEIEVLAGIGEYVHEDKPMANVYMIEEADFPINDFFVIGNERTSEQDIEFAMQKLVEISLRAISPGINDPNTANDIIIRLGNLLGKIGQHQTGDIIFADKQDKGV